MNLLALQQETEEYARELGLDFPEVIFEVVDWQQMNQVLAYNGFPVRYPHWTFGMHYNRYQRGYDWKTFRVYELVINTDPCVAYLLSSNELHAQKMVMLHVYGHAHFFKNNAWFAHTNRDMLNKMANHATRVRRYIDRFGLDKVESFLDLLFSIDNLIDVHSVAIRRRPERKKKQDTELSRLPAQGYMDRFINPRDEIRKQQKKLLEEKTKSEAPRKIPIQSEQDVLLFLLEHAPLQNWQLGLLEIVRDEQYYFVPQAQTKIMNEGFASLVHSRLMTQKACTAADIVEYAKMHSGILVKTRNKLNPYRLGYNLLLDIEKRWNRGMFGRDWELCTDRKELKNWDMQLGQGFQKVLDVIRVYNDIGFLDEFLTYEFAQEQRLFTYDLDKRENVYKITGRDFDEIKRRLLFSRTNLGSPIIFVQDGNFENRGELLLEHKYCDFPLDLKFAKGTLRALYGIWRRPVHIKTVMHIHYVDGSLREKLHARLSYDDDGYHQKTFEKYKGE